MSRVSVGKDMGRIYAVRLTAAATEGAFSLKQTPGMSRSLAVRALHSSDGLVSCSQLLSADACSPPPLLFALT